MERHVKERLIGATVLVAAAIILVPEMLSGPEPVGAPAADTSAESLRTYSVDLDPTTAPAREAATEAVPDEPSSQSFSAPPAEAPAETASAAAAEAQNTTPPEPNSEDVPAAATAEAPPARTAPPEPAPAPTMPAAGGWVVQAGSFSTRAKATEVAHDLEQRGFAAVVRSGTVNGKTMYRVRIGPAAERSAAESLLAKVKPHSPGAAVVRQ